MVRESIGINSDQSSSRFPVAPAETLAAARTITSDELDRFQFFAFDPGGAGRDVALPAASRSKGAVVYVANTADAAEVLSVKDGATTVVTPTQNEAAVVWCDGTSWFGLVGDFA